MKGFTLIEIIIYIAILSLILSSLISVSYELMISTAFGQNDILALEEAEYWFLRTSLALNNVSKIISPPPGSQDSILEVYKKDFPSTPILVQQSGLSFKRGNGGSSENYLEADFNSDTQSFHWIKYLP